MDESCQALRLLIDEIGHRLYSSAVATQVRRIQDGVFTFDSPHCLLSHKVGSCEQLIGVMREVQRKILEDEGNPVGRRHRKRVKEHFFGGGEAMRGLIERNRRRAELNELPRGFLEEGERRREEERSFERRFLDGGNDEERERNGLDAKKSPRSELPEFFKSD